MTLTISLLPWSQVQIQSLTALHLWSQPWTLWHPHLPPSWLMTPIPRVRFPAWSGSQPILAADHATIMNCDREIQALAEEAKDFQCCMATEVSHT